jgi:hypothetical protein
MEELLTEIEEYSHNKTESERKNDLKHGLNDNADNIKMS